MPQPNFSFDSSGNHEIQYSYHPPGEYKNKDLLGSGSWKEIYSACSKNNSSLLGFQTKDQETHPLSTPVFAETLKRYRSSDLDSLDLLKNYASGFTKTKEKKDQNIKIHEKGSSSRAKKLSTEEIMKMAAERYMEFTTQGIDHNHMSIRPDSSAFLGLSTEDLRDVDLVHFLLAAAEKVGYRHYEQASRLLSRCDWLASDAGNPIQRVTYYFAEALKERIGKETGKIVARRIEEKEKHDVPSLSMRTNLVFLKFHQEMPFNPVMVFTGIQAILERVEKESKIHVIDFNIRSGVQWTAFIQVLSERVTNAVQHLRITAVALSDREQIEETGKSLETFAKSLKLRFSFSVVFLPEMQEIKQAHFQVKSREAVVIYCPVVLRTMIAKPHSLENLMRVIKKLNPTIMVVTEVEANHNSPSFFNRFIETLLFHSAYFDCLEDCTDRDDCYRSTLERVFFGDGIRNIIAAEGEDRFTRSVKMDVWETFFRKFGMVQLDISESSLYHANFLLERFACSSSCTLEKMGKSLAVGWKGTPLQALSTWKFY